MAMQDPSPSDTRDGLPGGFVGFAEQHLRDVGGRAIDELPLTTEEVDYLLDTGIIAGHERYNGRDRPPIREPACRHDFGAYVCAACHRGHYETTIAETYLGRGYSDPPLDPGRVKAQITLLRRLARDSIERPRLSAVNVAFDSEGAVVKAAPGTAIHWLQEQDERRAPLLDLARANIVDAGGELTFEEFARQANAIARQFGSRYLPFPGAEPACGAREAPRGPRDPTLCQGGPVKSYVVLIKPFAKGEFYANGVNIAFRGDVDLATELSGDEVVSRALGGELILIGPLEGQVPRMRRFRVSQDGYVGEREPSHGLLNGLEQLLLRALYTHTVDAASETPAEAANACGTIDGPDRANLQSLLEEERADRQ